jgi:hypothetical protein
MNTDHLSKEGAELLARRLEAHWQDCRIRFRVEQGGTGHGRHPFYAVRSNLRFGSPTNKEKKSNESNP